MRPRSARKRKSDTAVTRHRAQLDLRDEVVREPLAQQRIGLSVGRVRSPSDLRATASVDGRHAPPPPRRVAPPAACRFMLAACLGRVRHRYGGRPAAVLPGNVGHERDCLPFSPRFHALQRCPGAPRRARAPKLPGGAHRGWAGPPARRGRRRRTALVHQLQKKSGALRQRHAARGPHLSTHRAPRAMTAAEHRRRADAAAAVPGSRRRARSRTHVASAAALAASLAYACGAVLRNPRCIAAFARLSSLLSWQRSC